MLSEKSDPSGAAHIKQWALNLRSLGPERPPRTFVQRMLHPGLVPASGNGITAALPIGQLYVAGENCQSLVLLHVLDGEPASGEETNAHTRDALLGGLLTLVADRRCQVLPEMSLKVQGQPQTVFYPLTGHLDSLLGAPMPDWIEIERDVREALARISSLQDEDAEAVCSAMHLHYCASLLLPRDMTGAYALVVAGLETLAMRFGNPPKSWEAWDQSDSWEKFFKSQELTEKQSSAFRERLIADKHMRLAETFGTYVSERLPAGFWEEEVKNYVWGIDGTTGVPLEGSWTEGEPRDRHFGDNRAKVKQAFKKAYNARSQFMHAGRQTVSFVDDLFGDDSDRNRSRVSFAQARAALRRLILLELDELGDPDPAGLVGVGFEFAEPPAQGLP